MIASNYQLIRISLIKDIKVIYSENITMKETLQCTQIGRINKVIMILKVKNMLI